MDFLPKEIEDIILDYKYQLEHIEKMKKTLFTISNLEIYSQIDTSFNPNKRKTLECMSRDTTLFCYYCLNDNDKNKIKFIKTKYKSYDTTKRCLCITLRNYENIYVDYL